MTTTKSLDHWLTEPGAAYYRLIKSPLLGDHVGIHDSRAIENIRWELWHLADYRVEAVQAGVIWLTPRSNPLISPASALRFEVERKGER